MPFARTVGVNPQPRGEYRIIFSSNSSTFFLPSIFTGRLAGMFTNSLAKGFTIYLLLEGDFRGAMRKTSKPQSSIFLFLFLKNQTLKIGKERPLLAKLR